MRYHQKLYYIIQYFGFIWLARRVFYKCKVKTGYFRWKCPQYSWARAIQISGSKKQENSSTSRFVINRSTERTRNALKDALHNTANIDRLVKKADAICNGTFTLFSAHPISVKHKPEWFKNYLHHQYYPSHLHWSQIDEFSHGDVKCVWELSRFQWAWPLMRGYVLTDNKKYAERFWKLFYDWLFHNPPNTGIHWKCGQEIAIRALVLIYAYHIFGPSSDRKQMEKLKDVLSVLAWRICQNTNYALQQKNNHAVSEGAALWLIGVLFPDFKMANKWRKTGLKCLTISAKYLISRTGAFAQHSVNYHRLVLQWYTQVLCVAELNNIDLGVIIKQKISLAFYWLYDVVDHKSGSAPNTGANDGALIFPMNDCDYQDYRPTLQCLSRLLFKSACFEEGIWDEDCLWMLGPDRFNTPSQCLLPKARLPSTGNHCFTSRDDGQYVFIHLPHYDYRPSQADNGHIDLWWEGINILRDPGTYSYHPSLYQYDFSHSRYHNTITVDEASCMEKCSQFIWLPWVKTHVEYESIACDNRVAMLRFNLSYRLNQNKIIHRRELTVDKNTHTVTLLDDIQASQRSYIQLHYNLPDMPLRSLSSDGQWALSTPKGDYYIHVAEMTQKAEQCVIGSNENKAGYGKLASHYCKLAQGKSLITSIHQTRAQFKSVFSPCKINVAQRESG